MTFKEGGELGGAPAAGEMARDASGLADVALREMPRAATWACAMCAPVAAPCGLWMQQPKKETVVTNAGLVTAIVTTEGIHWHNPCCRAMYHISTAQSTFDLSRQEITDLHGNPMIVSAVLTFRFVDPRKALLNVVKPKSFVKQLATAVIKEVVGKYSYDELKLSGEAISAEAVRELQPRVATAGCKIVDITLNEVSYSTVIAGAMLRKQQAEQLLAARSLLVTGAVEIATKALDSLETSASYLAPEERAKLVSDLIVLSVAEQTGK